MYLNSEFLMYEQYFPLGIAQGNSFLGRKDEIKHLQNNVMNNYHSLLLAPRRYGKTSLARHVIDLIQFPCVEIDLFVAQNEFSIEHKFIKGVQSIINEIDAPESWFKLLMNFFKNANKTWTVGLKGLKLELTPEHHKDIPENILEALNALEYVLSKKKLRAVLFIDEFQEIADTKISPAIEGAIRHFAQAAKHVVFIFSGSSRHMLMHMFGDKSRPLYALCDVINLNKLPKDDYKEYLNDVAQKTWKKKLSEKVLDQIFEVTETHPRYVYQLCIYLWQQCSKKLPEIQDVSYAWTKLVNDRFKDTREILSKRSSSQIKILSLISLGYDTEISGQLAQSKLGISSSAIVQSLRQLEQEDFVEKVSDGSYKILDPLLKSTFILFGSDYFI